LPTFMPTAKHYADVKIGRQWQRQTAAVTAIKLRYDRAALKPPEPAL
jgi:hypothetical protein